jgi:NitT/TauT family transport system ATP-binding protein
MPALSSAGIEFADAAMRFARGPFAVRGVTATIAAGQFVSLLGPSGCGKSTLLRLAAGLLEPAEGRVLVDGRPAAGRPVPMSYVFQDPTLMPWSSVVDNVALPLRIRGQARRAAREAARSALAQVGLADRARDYPEELSGGMKMRCSIARALVTGPSVLLLDEPFAALDEITRQRLNDELLAQWQARPMTAVFVTHSVFEAVYLSQRVLVMGAAAGRPGHLVADLPVTLPYPRCAGLRMTEPFMQACRAVSDALDRGAGAPAEAQAVLP